jgi:pimeloyl-ACP methyl ester carboxylesterase
LQSIFSTFFLHALSECGRARRPLIIDGASAPHQRQDTAMLRSRRSLLSLAAITILTAPALAIAVAQGTPATATAQAATMTASKSGKVEVDGISYHYEIYGEGEPLLLLHGGLGSIDMFQPILPLLAAKRQVIGVDLQGHGRTTLGTRPISLPAMGADMATILKQLGYEQVDVFGYSMGSGVAFQLAVQHPELVRRLALASAPFARDGFYPEMLEAQAQVSGKMLDAMKETPMYKSYMAVAPNPGDFPKLLDQMGNLMRTDYDWSAAVAKLTMPVMLVYADSDMIRPEHIVKFYQLLGGGLRDAGWQREHMSQNRLAILPGFTHYDLFLAPELAHTVLPFLTGETRGASWADQTK